MSMAAPVSAAQAVGEFLQSPDDLLKLAAFRKKLEKEKASLDVRLKNGVKEQLDATRDGLRKLFSTRSNVQGMKDEMEVVERMGGDPQNVVSTFDQISRVSMVHRNFEQTEEMVNNFIDMSDKMDSLEAMLVADSEDLLGPAPNLLRIHYQLTRLEAFRNQTMHQAKKSSQNTRATLTRYFDRLNKLIHAFDEYILDLSRNVLPIVRAGHPEVIVKLLKIVDMEGREDEKAVALKLVKKAAKLDVASKFQSLLANARVIKHYRSKLQKCIIESIKTRFADAYAKGNEDPSAFLDNSLWIYQDLMRIEEEVVPCFPADYNIHALYVREYHRALDALLKKMVSTEPEASVLLALHEWIKEYKKNMKELGIPQELMDPPLLGGSEQGLIDDYLKLIIKKLDEWSNNLMKTEIEAFTTRSEQPEVDNDGLYGMQGSVILFQMVNQQVDSAMDSGQGVILARVVEEVSRKMRSIQDQWTRLLDAEFKKHTESKPDEVTGGLVEYCIALSNDMVKSADFAEALSARIEPLVSEKYRATIHDRLNDAIDGYLDVTKKCNQVLIDIVWNDLKPATKQLFQPPWYDGVLAQIVETMRDYFIDYQAYLNQSLFEVLIEDLVDSFLVTYITALANAPKLKIPAATERIKDDISEAFKFFAAFKKPKELEGLFEVLEMIVSMLEASKSLVFLSYWSFAKVHGPNIAFVENLMKARGDLDRTAVGEVMESIKRKVKDEGLTDPEEPTVMKKIAIQGTFSRLLAQART
ncbi:hypothetical protein EIP86_005574 [Pleurotus ostreatoroseus]|nr:hypothetical protein EIP86_005574 [Pleurotus ostreatoroseus]